MLEIITKDFVKKWIKSVEHFWAKFKKKKKFVVRKLSIFIAFIIITVNPTCVRRLCDHLEDQTTAINIWIQNGRCCREKIVCRYTCKLTFFCRRTACSTHSSDLSFSNATAGHERNTVHDEYTELSVFMQRASFFCLNLTLAQVSLPSIHSGCKKKKT